MSALLTSLAIPNKEVEVEYPGLDGFKVKVAFQSRESLIALRKKATTKKWNRSRELVEEVDDQLFLQLYVKAVVKGWTGLKFVYLPKLMLVDLSKLTDEEMEGELKYSEDEAFALMKGSVVFDQFVSDTVADISNFPNSSSNK